MRIIAGEFRSRRIEAPKGTDTRPTTDRVRESLFQHLAVSRIEGGFTDRHVLDLFAGSGALGLEALSRGASTVTLVDDGRPALTALQRNVATLGVSARARVVRGRLPGWLDRADPPGRGWDLVFADPPYAREGLGDVLKRLRPRIAPDAWVIYERAANAGPFCAPDGWCVEGHRDWSATSYVFLRPSPDIE